MKERILFVMTTTQLIGLNSMEWKIQCSIVRTGSIVIWWNLIHFHFSPILELEKLMSTAFTKSLASARSRDITFIYLMPWFQVQAITLTLTLTQTKIPNHTLTLWLYNPIPNPNPTEKWIIFSCLAENWSCDHLKKQFFAYNSSELHF